MYHPFRIFFMTSVTLMSQASFSAGARASCDVPELYDPPLRYTERYNELVCDAVRLMDSGRHTAAANVMEEALTILFTDTPNYQLLPRLALAYHQAGRPADAKSTLRQSELALSIVTGLIECTWTEPPGELLLHRHGRPMALPTGPEEDATIGRMCGGAYVRHHGVFQKERIDKLGWEIAQIEYYLYVKSQIDGSATDRTR